MKQLTILGSGAAPGVPSLGRGWGACDPQNPKNRRLRTSAYLEYDGVRLLIDTSPDLRLQLLANDIRYLDGVLYTHAHADHVHGIDDIREINRIIRQNLHFMPEKRRFVISGIIFLICFQSRTRSTMWSGCRVWCRILSKPTVRLTSKA